MRTRSDRLVAVATLGAFVVVAGGLGLVSLYLGAVTQAMSGVQRTASLPEYEGRPAEQRTDGNGAMRYVVLVTDENGALASAYLAQLTAARDALHLIGLPANLLVRDPHGEDATLAARYQEGPDAAVRAIEGLVNVRVDHLVQVELEGFTRIIDVLGGVTVDNRNQMVAEGWHCAAREVRLTGAEAQIYLSSSTHSMTRLERTEAVFVEIVRGMASGDALTNPAKVEAIGSVLNSCVVVDAGLTEGEIRRMALDMHLSSDGVSGGPLPVAGISDLKGVSVIVPDDVRIRALTVALQADQVGGWVAGQVSPWQPLAQLPPR